MENICSKKINKGCFRGDQRVDDGSSAGVFRRGNADQWVLIIEHCGGKREGDDGARVVERDRI